MPILLSQSEAEALIALAKRSDEEKIYVFPAAGEKIQIPLVSIDRTEDFQLDITRSRIDISKVTNQVRGREVVILMRLDINGPPHRNPDDEVIPCPHLHVYQEGYGDKWAYLIDPAIFTDLSNLFQTLADFMKACNVTEPPLVQGGLF